METVFTLIIIAIILPVLFIMIHFAETRGESQKQHQILMRERQAMHQYIDQELRGSYSLQVNKNDLIAKQVNGDEIRVRCQNNRLIRSIKKQNESTFQGTMILATQIEKCNWIREGKGIRMSVHFASNSKKQSRFMEMLLYAKK
ncbi:Putative Competence protein ComGF [Thermoactinomyces sp. DSM 45891]|uniref:competence type IV pilus minor pilin ComGF n=1 Tax=Thermoactinomyces sp. DSM 45891 TaxID=1761907 RepID=UPI000912C0DA|nr:competence type IV pilus minor pilin ComGF [Thermoactinomyces sp. DSM 45891]SFX28494.1 Putative Competence protein ComGF [Thermoactinomyces sp. DSM 45891]